MITHRGVEEPEGEEERRERERERGGSGCMGDGALVIKPPPLTDCVPRFSAQQDPVDVHIPLPLSSLG